MGCLISFCRDPFADPRYDSVQELKTHMEEAEIARAKEYGIDLWPTPAASRGDVGESSSDDIIPRSYAEVIDLSMRVPWDCIIPRTERDAMRFILRFRAHIPNSVVQRCSHVPADFKAVYCCWY